MSLRHDPEAQPVHPSKVPASHRDDPETSRDAALAKMRGGTLESDRALALSLVERFQGSTVKEMIAWSDIHASDFERQRQRIGRRMSELADAGLIHAKGKRDGCMCWWPGPEPESAAQGVLFATPERLVTD